MTSRRRARAGTDEIDRGGHAEGDLRPGVDGEIHHQRGAGRISGEFRAHRALAPPADARIPRCRGCGRSSSPCRPWHGAAPPASHPARHDTARASVPASGCRAGPGAMPDQVLRVRSGVRTQHLVRHIAARGEPLPQIGRGGLAAVVQRAVMVGRQRVVPAGFGVTRQDQALVIGGTASCDRPTVPASLHRPCDTGQARRTAQPWSCSLRRVRYQDSHGRRADHSPAAPSAPTGQASRQGFARSVAGVGARRRGRSSRRFSAKRAAKADHQALPCHAPAAAPGCRHAAPVRSAQ